MVRKVQDGGGLHGRTIKRVSALNDVEAGFFFRFYKQASVQIPESNKSCFLDS